MDMWMTKIEIHSLDHMIILVSFLALYSFTDNFATLSEGQQRHAEACEILWDFVKSPW